jgi:uncharacterized protein with ParB-like and HNH nuclease domain
MKAGKYSIKELFNNRNVDQIVIPEIQRDYVWGKKEVEGLLNSIKEDFEDFKKGIDRNLVPQADTEIKKAFELYYKKQKFSCNIGFIYAYNDPDYSGKYFLIDGQQRLTTIYLLLLVLASEKHEFRDKFIKLYTLAGIPIIDYRVREASHYFLKEVVANYFNSGIEITDQSWFYKEYKSDKTISSIVSNIETIRKYLIAKNIINNDFINYVQDYIEFWYFDTNISEQGEELYIYMNARGEQMQENENLKADLLGKLEQLDGSTKSLSEIKNDWGSKWEEWQQFFWMNKNENPNLDKGFNEFINCIAGLENYLEKHQIIYTKEDFDNGERGKKNQIAYSDILSLFSKNGLEKISGYIEVLNYFFNNENIQQFKDNYGNATWIEKCLSEILIILNSRTTNWFAKLDDPDRGLEHSRMVFIWSLLLYMNTRDKVSRSNTEIYRVLRLYYIRFKNYNRSVQSIASDVQNVNQVGTWKVVGIEEENKKNVWYTQKIKPDDLRKFEELIWEIEDHPLNIDGRDAKAINCSHLIDFDKEPSIDDLKLIRDKFYTLFPLNQDGKVMEVNFKKLINILLFYGEFWERVSPMYCYNYYFGNWKKIIRNIDTKTGVFKMFFSNFKLKTLDDLYTEKVVKFDIDAKTKDFAEQIKWYATELNERLWSQGLYIVFEHYNNPNNDSKFINTREILNTKGDFKGGDPKVLSNLLNQ